VPPSYDDGSTVVNSAAAHYGMVMDLEGIIKTENDLIRRYREISQYADCDSAIEDIVNEAIIAEEDKQAVKESVTVKRTLAGSIKGTFVLPLANDFDAPLEDFDDYR
jgi:hypothetical protein